MSEKWPIVQWTLNGAKRFRVEDPEEYNYSFDTWEEADAYRQAAGTYNRTIKAKEKEAVARFKEGLYS